MKTMTKIATVALTGMLLLGAAPQRAQADDKTWATVGKILTGFVAADVAFNHSDRGRGHEPAYSRTTVIHRYGAPVHREPPPRWIPGHYETRCDNVWVEGFYRTVETPPVYGWVWDRGCRRQVWAIVQPASCTRVWVPGHYEQRNVQIWVEGCYVRG